MRVLMLLLVLTYSIKYTHQSFYVKIGFMKKPSPPFKIKLCVMPQCALSSEKKEYIVKSYDEREVFYMCHDRFIDYITKINKATH